MLEVPISIKRTAKAVVASAKEMLEEADGVLVGDAQCGAFRTPTPLGEIVGEYEISGKKLLVRITEKPFLVTEGLVRNKLNEYFV